MTSPSEHESSNPDNISDEDRRLLQQLITLLGLEPVTTSEAERKARLARERAYIKKHSEKPSDG